jgi:hypothetical protein
MTGYLDGSGRISSTWRCFLAFFTIGADGVAVLSIQNIALDEIISWPMWTLNGNLNAADCFADKKVCPSQDPPLWLRFGLPVLRPRFDKLGR